MAHPLCNTSCFHLKGITCNIHRVKVRRNLVLNNKGKCRLWITVCSSCIINAWGKNANGILDHEHSSDYVLYLYITEKEIISPYVWIGLWGIVMFMF